MGFARALPILRAGVRHPHILVTTRPLTVFVTLSARCFAASIDIGFGEVVSLEQQGLATSERQRIGKAISIVQRGGMASLAVATPDSTRGTGLFGVEWNDLGSDL